MDREREAKNEVARQLRDVANRLRDEATEMRVMTPKSVRMVLEASDYDFLVAQRRGPKSAKSIEYAIRYMESEMDQAAQAKMESRPESPPDIHQA